MKTTPATLLREINKVLAAAGYVQKRNIPQAERTGVMVEARKVYTAQRDTCGNVVVDPLAGGHWSIPLRQELLQAAQGVLTNDARLKVEEAIGGSLIVNWKE